MTGVMPEIKLPFPHPGQQGVLKQARRFNWLSAGRRWRKTTLGMMIAVESAIEGKEIFWGAPTYDQVRLAWRETKRAAGAVFEFTQMRMTAECGMTGGRIVYRSLDDPDNARGHSADGVIIDEVGDVKDEAWYEVLRPVLIDTGGFLWAVGTPKGRNWFWREHRNALDREDSISWQVPTVGCEVVDDVLVRKVHPLENPDIEFDEIKQIYKTTPVDIFKQEILAEFIENEGAVFRNIQACMGAGKADPEEHKEHHVVMGVDWGKQNDFTAISIGCKDCQQELAIDRFNKIDYAFQRKRLESLVDQWYVRGILPERNSMGEPIIEQLMRDGLPVQRGHDGDFGFQTTASTKPPLIENLALAFEKEEWAFIDNPTWNAELEAYERTVSSATGRSKYNAPSGMHDDTVMARALMLRAAHSVSWLL